MIGRTELKLLCWVGAMLAPALLYASSELIQDRVLDDMQAADVVFLGEQHDNPHHHMVQAAYVEALAPAALVFEMLTDEQASKVTPELLNDQKALEEALGWEASGWPDFSMYYPIFKAAPKAKILGAGVPRDELRDIFGQDMSDALDPAFVRRFELDQPLPVNQQSARETLQREAHCNALPEDLLSAMVDVQRLRDATLARVALDGLEQTGGTVVVITGNGHARSDWGAPFKVRVAARDVVVFTLGQGEDGTVPPGGYTHVSNAPSVDRGDPCDAFR